MKKNINLLQSDKDLSPGILDQAQKEYILQALANLGQRIGIKGDGLSYKSFSFLDLINEYDNEYLLDNCIGYVDYSTKDNDPITIFGIHNIKDGTDKILESLTTKSVNNILYFDSEFSFSIPVNGIEKYTKGSIISNENNILTILTVGKLVGYEDNNENNAVLLYYKFDISSNKVIYIAKLRNIYNDTNYSYYSLLRLYRDKDENDIDYVNKFNLNIQIFNSNILGNIYKSSFSQLFNYDNYNKNIDLGFNFLRPEFIDIDKLEGVGDNYNDDLTYKYDSNSPIAVILNNNDTNIYNKSELKLEYDTIKNEFICISNNYNEIIKLYKNEYNFLDIEEDIYNINNDIIELYPNMFSYYNEKYYVENRVTFFKRMLCKYYENLNVDNSFGRLYVPFNYVISYICNSNNELNIYYSTDTYILLTNLNEKYNKEDILSSNKYIIYDYNNIDVVKSFKFEVEYNKYLEDIINNVYVKEIYTMPYVNDEENWNINGENTNIRAVGKNAGNPNIIIIYSKDKEENSNSYKLINAINNTDVILKSGFIRNEFLVNNKLFNNVADKEIYCYAWLPVIDDTNKTALENSIIVNICDLNCLKEETYIDSYLGSNIITIWYYGKENNSFKFLLVNEDNYALPLGVSTNIKSLNESSYDLNAKDLLLLNANISQLAQEKLNTSDLNLIILKNKTAEEYNSNESQQQVFDYHNDLNAILEFTDDVNNIDKNKIKEIQTKYLSNFSEINTTNVLYPKYSIKDVIETKKIKALKDTLQKELQTSELIEINVNNQNVIVSKEILDELVDVITPEEYEQDVEVHYRKLSKLQENYNEYVFNSNVPNLDLKEVFLRNINNLNRVNLIIPDANGNLYYGYIGSSYEEYNKSTLHIGTSNLNINVGSNSILDELNRDQFTKLNKLSLDFNEVLINSDKSFSGNNIYIYSKTLNDSTYRFAKYDVLDLCEDLSSYFIVTNYNKFSGDGGVKLLNLKNDNNQINKDIYQSIINKNIIKIDNVSINDTLFYGVCINSLCKNLFNIDVNFDYYQEIHIISYEPSLYIYDNNDITPLFFIKLNNDSLYEIDDKILSTNNISIITNIDTNNEDGKQKLTIIVNSNTNSIINVNSNMYTNSTIVSKFKCEKYGNINNYTKL